MSPKIQAILESMKQQAIKDAKVLVRNQVTIAFDPLMEEARAAGKKAIPGELADSIIDVVVNTVSPILKEGLTKFLDSVGEEKEQLPAPQV